MSSSSTIKTLFSGISDPSNYPPHNGLAVGPNNIVMAEGSQIEWTNLSGGAATPQSLYQFFQPLGATATNALFDPRCVYDNVNNRYIVTVDNIGSNGTISNIDVAVSKDSNPNDGWYFASLNTSITINGALTASDQPLVSVDGTNIYITAPQYNVSGPGYQGTECWVIGDTAGPGGGIYNGGTLTAVANQITPSTQGIFRVVAASNGKSYYACDYSTGSQIVVTLQTYDVATNTFGPASTVALGNIDQGGSYTAQQQGTTLLLDAGDKRIQNLAYANGFLYGVSEEKPIGSSVPEVHWFKIDVSSPNNPSLVAQGDISGATIGTNVATFDASIAADGAGDVIINFTASGPNMYPSDYYVYEAATDPPNSFSAPILYQASTGYFNSGNGASIQRWGLNSSAIVDPNNSRSFWISGEYVANGWWQTSVAQVAINTTITTPPPAPTGLSLDTTTDSGTKGDGITNFAQVKIDGTAAAGSTVTLYDTNGTTVLGTGTADATTGAFSIMTSTLSDGTHSITAKATDTAGNTSAASTAYSVTVDTIPPAVTERLVNDTGSSSTDKITSNDALTGSGDANAVVHFTVDGTAVAGTATGDSSGIWTFTPPTLADGQHTVVASETDAAGNVGTASLTFTLDTTPPVVAITSTGGSVNQATQTVTGTVDVADAGTTVTVFDGATQAGTATVQTNGSWSTSVTLAAGTNTLTAKDTDAAGNTGVSNAVTYTLSTTAPTVSSIVASGPGITNGTGDLNAGKVVTLTVNFSATVTVNTAGGTPTLSLNDGGTAAYTGGSGTSALAFSYTVLAGQNTPDLVVASFALNGATIQDAAGNAANLSGATNYNPAGILQIDTTPPTIAINTIAGDNIVNAAEASSGFTISGTSTGVENGQTVTVNIVNSSNTVVDSYTTTDQSNAWSVQVTSAQATALADGSYTVTANVADAAGNPAPQAALALTVDEDKTAEPPTLTVTSASLTVSAGGSVPLGITATPFDSDDTVSVTITGLPKYDTITAPAGDTVTSKRQKNGTYTWTVTESASAAGTPLTGVTLSSSYTGTGHPTATLTVTASDTTSGETAASPSQTIAVTDPPATMIANTDPERTPLEQSLEVSAGPAPFDQFVALLDQFAAAGFHNDRNGGGQMTAAFARPISRFDGHDQIDLLDVGFSNATMLCNPGDNTHGVLSVSDGSHTANIALLANYMASSFAMTSDGHGGTLVTNQPMASLADQPTLALSQHV